MFRLFKTRKTNLTDLNEAVRLFKSGHLEEALRRSEAIIESAPGVALSHRFKGEILFELSRFSECHAPFLKAEEIGGPGTEECFFWRALAHANAGETQQAIHLLETFAQSPDANPDLITKCKAALAQIRDT